MIVANDVTNDSRVIKEAASFVKAGFAVNVLGIHNPGLDLIETIDGFNVKRIVIMSRSLKSKLLLPIKGFEYIFRTLEQAIIINADIYHCHDIDPMVIAWLASRIRQVELSYDSHELEYDRNLSKPRRWLNRIYERMFINKVDRIIVSDGKYRAAVMAKKNNCSKPMTFVMNCPPKVDINIEDRKKIREMLKIPEAIKIILYIGNLFAGRGIKNMFDVLSRLNNVVLVVMGKRYDSEISYWGHKFGVEGKLKFIGPFHYSEVSKIASGADLGLSLIENTCLSYYHSIPTKLFDYMAAGLPIIASNFPAMEDIVLCNPIGPIGICVDPENPEEIAEAVRQLIDDDREQYAIMRENARNLHISEYNWEHQESKLIDTYSFLHSKT